jgi:serine/threonine protein kinase
MEVFEAIIEYLDFRKFSHVSDALKVELSGMNPGKAKSSREKRLLALIKDALRGKENEGAAEETEEIMEKLMTRLITAPTVVSSVDTKVDSLMHLRAFQKMVSCADQLFFDNESINSSRLLERQTVEEEDDLPHFGTGDHAPQARPTAKREAPPNDDELFSSARPDDDRQEPSAILQQSNASFGALTIEEEGVDEYEDDEDPGFEVYECNEEDMEQVSRQLGEKFNYPARAVGGRKTDARLKLDESATDKEADDSSIIAPQLPGRLRFPESGDEFYPMEHDGVVYDCYSLKVVYDREKTGFEESKEFQIVINSVIAGRYQVMEFLGQAAFSKAIQCLDLVTKQPVCLKIIENNKDYFDQSIDEIKLLKYISCNSDVDEHNVLRVLDYFYHKEHLFIVTELLRDNLYEFSRYNRENEEELYFTVGRLQRVAFQILTGLEYIHGLHLIHCDLKPENVLIKSYSRCEVKIIDFGSSCYIHDHLSSYVQSRSYRAPEVILGCKYDYRIDIWSLGCIIAELCTGNVLFQNDSVQGLLARVIGILGPIPEDMLERGRHVNNYFTNERLLYQQPSDDKKSKGNEHLNDEMVELIKQHRKSKPKVQLIVPKRSSLKARLKTDDAMFLDFVKCVLQVDKDRRPTAKEALQHPWITECKYVDGLP